MQTITISGKARAGVGKVATKADRAAGNIPCVMYAGNEVDKRSKLSPASK